MKKYQDVLALKPTQFSVGILEIEVKVQELSKLNKNKLKKYIKDNPIPIIISPTKDLYLVDHHHLLFTFFQMGITRVRTKVVDDLSKRHMSYSQFWQWMKKSHFYYPYCQFGEGPRNPLYLPNDIRGLADDPYRSLAWFVRKEGGYENSEKTFAEFSWANFFRHKKLLDRTGRQGLEKAIPKGVKLAQSKEASKLPGFIKKKTAKKKRS